MFCALAQNRTESSVALALAQASFARCLPGENILLCFHPSIRSGVEMLRSNAFSQKTRINMGMKRGAIAPWPTLLFLSRYFASDFASERDLEGECKRAIICKTVAKCCL